MLVSRKALTAVTATGRQLTRWSCPFTRVKQRPVHSSCSLGRQVTLQEVSSLEENVKSSLDKTYTLEQRDVLLRLLNSASESKLECVKELKGKTAASIVQYREQYGPFPDLASLQQLSFQPAFIHKLCQSMLSLHDRTDPKIVAKFLKPDIPVCRLQVRGQGRYSHRH
ncbi:unnamed protein product [Staurois parvus]|uniref:Uncharacterized protein n=1 Tax=Staurois parvus TaxID=386267 RepID=A0ABN9GT91_9NEOB|nr:unnamed protein product [Staurois parvus]